MSWYFTCFVLFLYASQFCYCHKDTYRARAWPKLRILHQFCALKKDEGPCKALMDRFYFDTEMGGCRRFDYGGCQGNANNFESLQECEKTCIVKPDSDPCHLDEDVGPCRGMMLRYFFNKTSQHCERFYYGGCYGNGNNFRTMGECQAKCHKRRQESTESVGNARTVLESGARTQGFPSSGTGPSSVCLGEVDAGVCGGLTRRYAYNVKTNRCHSFHYSGCGGNANNFASKKECVKACVKDAHKVFRGRIPPKLRSQEIIFQSV